MSWQIIAEYSAVAMNVVFLLLMMRENKWCWFWGGFASLLSIFLFIDGKLYAEAILYIYYVAIAIFAFFTWNRQKISPVVHRWSLLEHVLAVTIGLNVGGFLGYLFQTYTDASFPYFDAFITAFSFVATFMEARKVLSSWTWWLVLNLLSANLYFLKSLNMFALQMIFFAILCIPGYINWRKHMLLKNHEVKV